MTRRFRIAALAIAAAALAPAVHAASYSQVRPEKSAIDFTYTQMGVAMKGRFAKFDAKVAFDPAQPAAGSATVNVHVASIDAGSSEATQEAVGKSWFDAKTHPLATFASTGVKPLGGNRYEMTGRMTVKGRVKTIAVPVTFAAQGTEGTLSGTLVIRRSDFGIGEGEWAAPDIVGNDVNVAFRLVVAADPPAPAAAPAPPAAPKAPAAAKPAPAKPAPAKPAASAKPSACGSAANPGTAPKSQP